MLEEFGNIWDKQYYYDAVVITTNGFVKKNGEAVMGRGIALEAAKRYRELPERLGANLMLYGNKVWVFSFDYLGGETIITFPVKPEFGPNGEPGWKVKADIALIEQSAKELVEYIDSTSGYFNKIVMPRPGCGNGGLKWENVKPIIEPYLDDRFTVMEIR